MASYTNDAPESSPDPWAAHDGGRWEMGPDEAREALDAATFPQPDGEDCEPPAYDDDTPF